MAGGSVSQYNFLLALFYACVSALALLSIMSTPISERGPGQKPDHEHAEPPLFPEQSLKFAQMTTTVRPHRLYAKGKITGFQRAKRNVNENTSLLAIEGVRITEDAQFYLGKRVAYVYRASKAIKGSKVRIIWGRITRTHGNSGAVRAKFAHNLPPKSFGASVRVVCLSVNSLCRCSIPLRFKSNREMAQYLFFYFLELLKPANPII